MARTALKGQPVETVGALPQPGDVAPAFTLVKADLSALSLPELAGKWVILNVFPSIDTGVCAASVRRFNQEAAALEGTVVVCASMDLPFALGRFCGAEGIENVVAASAFRDPALGQAYGLRLAEGPLTGLLARAVIVIDPSGKVVDAQLVTEITQEPDYARALAAVQPDRTART